MEGSIENAQTESLRFILSQSNFSLKMEGQTNRGRQMEKWLAQLETHTAFIDFIGRYEVIYK